ncbi:MAG: hypothetical protein ABJF10_09015 [Chthoniobacter sp.]|uniref:hypothetical protein n=1 Tax=Chthoniobacter sp. TaxID=2510640 RepID=UPI0032A33D1B
MKEIETKESTPEQLMQMLEVQLAAQRSHRAQSGRNRAIILVAGILFIVVAASGALLVLDQMLVDLRQNERLPESGATPVNGK